MVLLGGSKCLVHVSEGKGPRETSDDETMSHSPRHVEKRLDAGEQRSDTNRLHRTAFQVRSHTWNDDGIFIS